MRVCDVKRKACVVKGLKGRNEAIGVRRWERSVTKLSPCLENGPGGDCGNRQRRRVIFTGGAAQPDFKEKDSGLSVCLHENKRGVGRQWMGD